MAYRNHYSRPRRTISGAAVLGILCIAGIIGLGVWLLPKLDTTSSTKDTSPKTTTGETHDDWYVGKKVQGAGTVEEAKGALEYTHTIILSGETKKIQLMSSTLDLSAYKGFMYIEGTISKYDDKIFTIDVSAIGATPDMLQNINLPINTSSRIMPLLGIKIDTARNNGIRYTLSGDTIVLSEEGKDSSLSIAGFRCEVGIPSKDCDSLVKEYSGGSFVSAGGMTYFKGTTTEQGQHMRFAQHNGGFGYRIVAGGDAQLYDLTNSIIPLNEAYILSLQPQVKQLCNTQANTKMTVIKDSLTQRIATIGSCSVRITLDESGEKLALQNTPTPSSTGSSTSQAPEKSPTASSFATGGKGPVATTNGLTYENTKGGYTITFPSAKISYTSSPIKEDLGVSDLLCYNRMDIKDILDKDNVKVGASVSIYECISKLGSATLMRKLPAYFFQTNANGTKLFFTKVHNTEWKEFARKVRVN